MKRAAIILAFILVLITLCAFMFQRWSRATLARMRATNAAERLAETNRIGAAPRRAILGTPRDADAAAEYLAAFERIERTTKRWSERHDLVAAAGAPPAPLPATLSAHVAANRAALEEVRAATRAARCTWSPFGPSEEVRANRSYIAQMAGAMLVLEGHDRLLAGDPAAAARSYLDALALGIDLATDATLLPYIRGLALAKMAATALAAVPCDAAEVEALARAVPSTQVAVRFDRLDSQRRFVEADSVAAVFHVEPTIPEKLLGRTLLALTASWFDGILRDAEAAYAIDDPAARKARCAEITARAEAYWLPYLHAYSLTETLRDPEDEVRAKLAAIVAAGRPK